ncbi:hypothetical protein GGX14DRAFT_443157 [Mycena pura]|uniref:Uncharacterized protein n=1 Tax=Mycena pura TaxID=153505 RepID=A0AAD6VKJ9_9AGAR|nr:hypothetical protein GGX14DRAFT_443157 [Mycena pura]
MAADVIIYVPELHFSTRFSSTNHHHALLRLPTRRSWICRGGRRAVQPAGAVVPHPRPKYDRNVVVHTIRHVRSVCIVSSTCFVAQRRRPHRSPVTLALFSSDSNVTYPGGLALAVVQNPQVNQVAVQFPQVEPGCVLSRFCRAIFASTAFHSTHPSAFSVGASAASASSTATAPPSASASGSASRSASDASAASLSASASSARSSIASAASGAISSASAAASSGLSSLASAASGAASAASASVSSSSSTGAGTPVRLLGPGAAPALAAALACVALGALAL